MQRFNDLLNGLRILVVDDEEDARDFLMFVFKQYGATVRSVASAVQALAEMDHWTPDVLVSDIGMPGMNGFDLIRRIRTSEAEKGTGIPAVAVTAYTRAEDRQRILAAGFQTYLAKPIDPAELVQAVATLAGRNEPVR